MATVVFFISGLSATVRQSPEDVLTSLHESGSVAELTLESGEPIYLRVEQVTHWHDLEADPGRRGPSEPSSKPRYGRDLPRTS